MSQFTNRHGKKVQVNDDQVAEVSSKPSKQANVTKPHVSDRVRWKRLSGKTMKRLAIVFVALVLVGLVGGLLTADSVKRDYERQTAAMKRSVTERSKQSTSQATNTTETISSLKQSLSANSSCNVTGIDVVSWYGPAKSAREECQKTAESYQKLQLAIDDMSSLAGYISSVNEALSRALADPNNGEFAIITDYQAAWVEAVSSLEKVTPPESIRTTHNDLRAKAIMARDAWTKLASSNSSQNAEEFKTSEKQLNEAYAELRTTMDRLHTLIASTQASINMYVASLSS